MSDLDDFVECDTSTDCDTDEEYEHWSGSDAGADPSSVCSPEDTFLGLRAAMHAKSLSPPCSSGAAEITSDHNDGSGPAEDLFNLSIILPEIKDPFLDNTLLLEMIAKKGAGKVSSEDLNDEEKLTEVLSAMNPKFKVEESLGAMGTTSLAHLQLLYCLLLHKGKELKEFCTTIKVPISGTKCEQSFRILEACSSPWERRIGPINDFPFDGPDEDGPSQSLIDKLPPVFDCLDFWTTYIPEDLRRKWVQWTNKKAQSFLTMDRPTWYTYDIWPPRWLSRWTPLTLDEMNVFLGTMIAKNCIASVSRRQFWRKESKLNLLSFSNLNRHMGRDRFTAISSALTIYPPEAELGNTTPYWKIQHLLDEFNMSCVSNYDCSRFISRDEQCIKNHHRTSLRHYKMPKRMIQEGIRVECVTSRLGVMQNCMLDLPGVTHYEQTMTLLSSLKRKGHVIFMDRLYTSAKLVKGALTLSQYVCGTTSSNKGFPALL